jgi:hypothetical protein
VQSAPDSGDFGSFRKQWEIRARQRIRRISGGYKEASRLGRPRPWRAQRCPADVLSRLWPSESGMTADPLTSGLRCDFGWCWGWRSNRSPQVNPRVIPMVIPQRTSPYAHVISEITTSPNHAGWPPPQEDDVRQMRIRVRSRGFVGARIQPAR